MQGFLLAKVFYALRLYLWSCVQILRRLLEQLNSSEVTVEQQLSILLELEYLVHQVRTHIHLWLHAFIVSLKMCHRLCLCVHIVGR